jgi:D-alanyl-D-alanine carboxypeptidase (penicillin-binding protein 5/6)
MLRSGNDSAVAIAEHIAGSEEKFAEISTARARELGAVQTTFKNPHGLSTPGHVTTAHDLARLARHALLRLPRFSEIVSTRHDTIEWDGRPYDRQLKNTNKLLWMFEGADGVKTGTTSEAGPCLVSSATREGQQLIAVVLHSGNRWTDSMKLLQYGFDNFTLLQYAEKNSAYGSLPLQGGMKECVDAIISENVYITVPKEQAKFVHVEYDIPEQIEAPVYQGQKLGEVVVSNQDKVLKIVDIVAGQDVQDRTFMRTTLTHLLSLYRKLAGWGWF